MQATTLERVPTIINSPIDSTGIITTATIATVLNRILDRSSDLPNMGQKTDEPPEKETRSQPIIRNDVTQINKYTRYKLQLIVDLANSRDDIAIRKGLKMGLDKCKTFKGEYKPDMVNKLFDLVAKHFPEVKAQYEKGRLSILANEKKAVMTNVVKDNITSERRISLKDLKANIKVFSNLAQNNTLPFTDDMKMRLIKEIVNNYSKEFFNFTSNSTVYMPEIPVDHIEKMMRNREIIESKFGDVIAEVTNYERSQTPYLKSRLANSAVTNFIELAEMFS